MASSKAIYIRGSPINVDETSLKDALTEFGPVAFVTVPMDKNFCFAEFETEEGAQAACAAGTVSVAGQSATVEARKGTRRSGPRADAGGGGGGGGGSGGRSSAARLAEGTSHSIYIAEVEAAAVREDLETAFGPFGTIVRSQFRTSLQGRKYAFVEFENADVVAAIVSGGPYTVCGKNVEVQERHSVGRPKTGGRGDGAPAHSNGHRSNGAAHGGGGGGRGAPRGGRLATPPKPENSVYVRGFPPDTAEGTIRSLFAAHGEIKSIIMRVKPTEDGDVRTWAFVEYATGDAVQTAIDATSGGLDIEGSEVVVEARKSEPKLFRGGGGPRGPGGGRRRTGGVGGDHGEGH